MSREQAVTCVGRLASTFDTQVPTERVCGPEQYTSTHQQHAWSLIKFKNLFRGQRVLGAQERTMPQSQPSKQQLLE